MNGHMEKTAALKPHPLSEKLYGPMRVISTPHFGELRDSIKAKGILVPLLVTADNQIISGHSRWYFAKMFDFEEVPVTVFASDDPLDVEEALIHANRQRAKTKEQIAREYKHLKGIEAKRAKDRQKASGGDRKSKVSKSVPENLPEPIGHGDSRDHAASQLGMSGKTADKMEAVVDAIDAAEEAGDDDLARELRDTLNTKSVSAAHRAISESKPEPGADAESDEEKEARHMQRRVARQVDEMKRIWSRSCQEARDTFLAWVGMEEAA